MDAGRYSGIKKILLHCPYREGWVGHEYCVVLQREQGRLGKRQFFGYSKVIGFVGELKELLMFCSQVLAIFGEAGQIEHLKGSPPPVLHNTSTWFSKYNIGQ